MVDVLRWVIAVAFAGFGALATTANYAYIAMSRPERHYSLIPLLGGSSIAVGLLVCPVYGLAHYAWLPLLLDPGCILMIVGGLASFILWRLRQRRRNE